MLIKVAFDGKKLFEWEGDADAVARIDEEVSRIAKANDMSPEALSLSIINAIMNNGGFLKAEGDDVGDDYNNHETQMMVVIWLLIALPTGLPDRPGRCRDYLEAWNFEFDVCPGHNDQAFQIDVKARPAHGTA
jgi:hypothetical protein